jgi:arginine utilization protein RocB
VLHVADRRERYDVMTVDCAELYANVFHLGGNPKREWRKLLSEVRRLTKLWDRQQRLRYNRFVARSNLKLPRYETTPEVIDFSELKSRVAAVAGADTVAACIDSSRDTDERQRALATIRNLHTQLPPGRPLVVVSLLPPFYPAQLNSAEARDTARLIAMTREEGLTHRRVYPYIADLSYFAFAKEAVDGWEENAPLWFEQGELDALRAGAAPVCNLGPWGAGAHSETERVYLPYLRDKLPRLLSRALHELCG